MNDPFGMGAVLLACAVKATVVLLVGWAATVALRHRSAAVRHGVWAATILGILALPVLTLVLPEWRVHVSRDTAVISREGASEVSATSSGMLPPVGNGLRTPAAAGAAAGSPELQRAGEWIVWCWALGSLVLGLRLAVGVLQVGFVTARSRPLVDKEWDAALAELSERAGIRRRVRLLESESALQMPFTWGLARPCIVVPAGAREWTAERREITLTHEVAHVARHDWVLQMLAEAAVALYWFHPLAWFAASKLRQESERACDDMVLNSGIDSSTYASQLVALAQTLRGPGYRLPVALAVARRTSLERRFAAMLKPSVNREPLSMKTVAVALLCCLSLLLPIAAMRLSAQSAAGDFTGSIRDASGGAVGTGSVTVTNRTAGTIDGTSSDGAGNFRFVGLPAGAYELRIEKAGFDSYTVPLMLEAGRPQALNAVLQIETAMQHVTITMNSPAKAPRMAASVAGGSVGEPRILSRKNPIYPKALATAGVEGDVIMRAIIGKDGSLLSVRVVNTQIDPQLAKAAVEAVNQWRYSPALLNGVAVETDTVISVAFRLQNPADALKN